jgi:hypothetical protein
MSKKPDPEVEAAIRQLETQALSFAYRFINISSVRSEYIRLTQEMSQNLRKAHADGEMSAKAAAEAAHGMRNEILEMQRSKSADLGKALARQMKAKGLSFDAVLEKAAQSIYKRPFAQLNNVEQTSAYMEVVASAGRARTSATRSAARAGAAGRALFVLSIGLAVYNIANAEDKAWQTGREAANIGGGFAGGVAAGALAGIWFGPLGVAIGAFVGGVAGALISDSAYVEATGPRGAFAKKFLPRFTSTFSTDEDGIAKALYDECGINMDQVHEIFRELDNSYTTDSDDVAVIYLKRVFGEKGRVLEALKLHHALRQLLIDVLDDGWTSSGEQQLIFSLKTLR